MRPGYQMGARERKEGISRPDGPCPRIMMIAVPERRACVALCLHWGLSGVEDLYIDWQVRDVRYQEVGAGSFLGIGEMPFLVPGEAVFEVAEERFSIEPGRTEKVDRPATFDTKVAPPRADEPRYDEVRLVAIKTVIDLL